MISLIASIIIICMILIINETDVAISTGCAMGISEKKNILQNIFGVKLKTTMTYNDCNHVKVYHFEPK